MKTENEFITVDEVRTMAQTQPSIPSEVVIGLVEELESTRKEILKTLPPLQEMQERFSDLVKENKQLSAEVEHLRDCISGRDSCETAQLRARLTQIEQAELKKLAKTGCGHCFAQDCEWPNCDPRAKELDAAHPAEAPQPQRIQCDGDHGGKNCGDPECWIDGEDSDGINSAVTWACTECDGTGKAKPSELRGPSWATGPTNYIKGLK